MKNKTNGPLGLILNLLLCFLIIVSSSLSQAKTASKKQRIKKIQENKLLRVDDAYKDLRREIERNIHPLQILTQPKYSHLFSNPVTPNSVRNFLRLHSIWLSELARDSTNTQKNDYAYTLQYYNKMARGTLYNAQLSPAEAAHIGLPTLASAINNLHFNELLQKLKVMEYNTYSLSWTATMTKESVFQGQKIEYIFDEELKASLANRAYENPEVLERLYQDASFAATLVKFSLLEHLAGKRGVEKKLRTKLLSSLTDGNFENFDHLLKNEHFMHRFFKVVSVMKKDSRLLTRILVNYLEHYPKRADQFVDILAKAPNSKQMKGFAKVLFLASKGKIPRVQAKFLAKMPFSNTVEEFASSGLKKTYGKVPESLFPFLTNYRKKASFGIRCSLAFRRKQPNLVSKKTI